MPVHRFEIHPREGQSDPRGEEARRAARSVLGWAPNAIRTAQVYLVEAELTEAQRQRIARTLLADAVTQDAVLGVRPPAPGARVVEVHPLPGVMDPVAQSVESAIRELLDESTSVLTGMRYDLSGVDQEQATTLARVVLANPTIHSVHLEPHLPAELPHGRETPFRLREVPIRDLDDAALMRLSREAHFFLSLDEMRAIREHYRALNREPRDIELETLAQTWSEHCVHKTLKSTITYRETDTAAQSPGTPVPGTHPLTPSPPHPLTWMRGRPGHTLNPDGSVTIHNLLKSTIAAATHELIADGLDWTLSVFVDNSGVIAFDDQTAVCFKVETHNHPSAIEPYGGAATGIGGCIRDIIGTGLAAKPIASTDVFCVAHPDHFTTIPLAPGSAGGPVRKDGFRTENVVIHPPAEPGANGGRPLPPGCLHPRRILSQVVAGMRNYGNRMGIPTVNGTVWFDDRYVGNPLVFCGCVGVLPRDMVRGEAKRGDRIIVLGGRTGRDGIHGATFSSAELTETHADEFGHAVQIGNAITEKKMLDAIMQARDHASGCLYNAITDCGAGGFSSAVGEMGATIGAEVHLDRAPLKYAGLTYTEVWISEAQERMVLAVPSEKLPTLRAICEIEDVELADLGAFGTPDGDLILNFRGEEVGRLSMEFLHEGIPMPVREAVWPGAWASSPCEIGSMGLQPVRSEFFRTGCKPMLRDALLSLLADPNICSKHWIIRQYDHEVQGATAIKPLVGPQRDGPSDAAVIIPPPPPPRRGGAAGGPTRGLAIANGLAVGWAGDPYLMALAAIDECVRNLVCVGADPNRIAILDNFCWPSCESPRNLAALVRAAEGCYDGAKAHRTPFISGKDSLNNQFTLDTGETIEIPPTLLISGFGIVPDVRRCVTMDAKRAGNSLILVGETSAVLGGSRYLEQVAGPAGFSPQNNTSPAINPSLPTTDLNLAPKAARAVASLIADRLVRSAHDCSEGGLLVAAAEMAFAGRIGLDLDLDAVPTHDGERPDLIARAFAETPSRYLLEIELESLDHVAQRLADLPWAVVGTFNDSQRLTERQSQLSATLDELRTAWRGSHDT